MQEESIENPLMVVVKDCSKQPPHIVSLNDNFRRSLLDLFEGKSVINVLIENGEEEVEVLIILLRKHKPYMLYRS